jgi:repressor LexA
MGVKYMIRTTLRGESTRKKILSALKMYHDRNGNVPTMRELADMIGAKSTSTIHRNLQVLKEEGKISWNKEMSRTVRVL